MNNKDDHITPGRKPLRYAEEVRHFTGPVSDHTVAAILNLNPTAEDLEIAVMFARGEGDRVARLGHELKGEAAQIHRILLEDELYIENEL